MRVNLQSIPPIALVIAIVTLAFGTLKPTNPHFNPPVALAQPAPSNDPGTTSRREPAGNRGDCPKVSLPFTPLLPITESGFSGSTLTEYPTFWFYVPYPNNSVREGKLTLKDIEGNRHARIQFKLPETPGFVSVSLPKTEKPLETNQRYRWTLILYCQSQESSDVTPIEHNGTIEKIEQSDLEAQLQTATLEERLNFYLYNQIWYDVATELVQIRDVPQAWRKLFDAMGMEDYDREPISGPVELK